MRGPGFWQEGAADAARKRRQQQQRIASDAKRWLALPPPAAPSSVYELLKRLCSEHAAFAGASLPQPAVVALSVAAANVLPSLAEVRLSAIKFCYSASNGRLPSPVRHSRPNCLNQSQVPIDATKARLQVGMPGFGGPRVTFVGAMRQAVQARTNSSTLLLFVAFPEKKSFLARPDSVLASSHSQPHNACRRGDWARCTSVTGHLSSSR